MNCQKGCCIIGVVFLCFIFTFYLNIGTLGAQEAFAPWKFAVISDTQSNAREIGNRSCINDAVVRAMARDIVREKPDFVLVAGDLVTGWFKNGGTGYSEQYSNWKRAMGPVYDEGIRIYPVRGNHDSGPERLTLPPLPEKLEPPADTVDRLKDTFRQSFAESYIPKNGPVCEKGLTYSFTHKNAFVIGLDQFSAGQHEINQDWINRQFAGNSSQHIFVYGHEPAFGTGHVDNLGFYTEKRDVFWDSIGKAGGMVYFCGHDHFYNRAVIPDGRGNNIRQVVAGTGGGNLRSWTGIYKDGAKVKGEYHNSDYHGYVLVIVDGPKITVIWKALKKLGLTDEWENLDIFTYNITFLQNGPLLYGQR